MSFTVRNVNQLTVLQNGVSNFLYFSFEDVNTFVAKQRKSHRKRKATTYNEDNILLPEERPIKAYGSFEELLR